MPNDKNVYSRIVMDLNNNYDINDTFVYFLWDYLAECVGKESQEVLKSDYSMLMEMLDGLYAYDQLDERGYSIKQCYLLGCIRGAMGLFSALENKNRQVSRMEYLIEKYSRGQYCRILQSIKHEHRMRNKELATLCKVQPSRISQIMRDFHKDELIVEMKTGNDKYYFLSEKGERLEQEIENKEDSCLQSNYHNVINKIPEGRFIRYKDIINTIDNTKLIYALTDRDDKSSLYYRNYGLGRDRVMGKKQESIFENVIIEQIKGNLKGLEKYNVLSEQWNKDEMYVNDEQNADDEEIYLYDVMMEDDEEWSTKNSEMSSQNIYNQQKEINMIKRLLYMN